MLSEGLIQKSISSDVARGNSTKLQGHNNKSNQWSHDNDACEKVNRINALLTFACLFAANCIISTSELKGVPRNEATTIVGTLLAFPPVVKDLPLLLPSKNELTLISSAEVKDQIIGVLLKSGKKEPAGLARCISLSSLGIFVYSELLHESFHPKIKEAIQVTMKEESSAILILSTSTYLCSTF